MITVVFSGAPSSGKTTLARALSEVLTVFGYTVHHVEEAAKGTVETATVQHYLLSAKNQLDIQCKCGAAEYRVIDSPVFLYGIYAHRILRVTDEAEFAAWSELKALCAEQTKTYRRPGCKLFHIQPVYQLESNAMESEIVDYISKFASAYVRLADSDLANRLECVLSYLNADWWDDDIKPIPAIIEKACDMAETSVLHDHTS